MYRTSSRDGVSSWEPGFPLGGVEETGIDDTTVSAGELEALYSLPDVLSESLPDRSRELDFDRLRPDLFKLASDGGKFPEHLCTPSYC